ncbi:hypothetical protein [Sphingobium ummariense]
MGCRFFIAWLLAIASTGSALQAADKLNSNERRALSPRAADRLAREELLSILRPSGRFPKGMMRQVRSMWFTTKSVGTSIPGLCARDTLILDYAPIIAPVNTEYYDYEGEPVAPSGVETSRQYRFVKAPTSSLLNMSASLPSTSVWRGECRSLKDDEDDRGWFSAPDPETAVRGWLAFRVATAAVQAKPALAQPCETYRRAGQKLDCQATLAMLDDLGKLNGVALCPASAGKSCYKIDVDNFWITVTSRESADGPTALDVESVKVEEYIVVT